MQKKDNYLFSLILVGCLFLVFYMLTYRVNYDNISLDMVGDYICQQLYIDEASDTDIVVKEVQCDNLCNTITKRSNLLRDRFGYRSKGMTLFFVVLIALCLWKQTSSFYFKINKKNNLDTFNVYETSVRRGPPIIISMTI